MTPPRSARQLSLGLTDPLATLMQRVPAFVDLTGYESARNAVFEVISAAAGTDAETLVAETIDGLSEAWVRGDLAAARRLVRHPFQRDIAEALLVGPEELGIVLALMRRQMRRQRHEAEPAPDVNDARRSLVARWNRLATEEPIVDLLRRERECTPVPRERHVEPRPYGNRYTPERSPRDGFRHALLVHIALLDARSRTGPEGKENR